MTKDFDEEYKTNLLHAEELEYAGDYKAAAELYSHLATVAKMKSEPQWNLIVALLTHSSYCFQKSNQLDRVSRCEQRIEKIKKDYEVDEGFHIGTSFHNSSHYELIKGFDKDFVEKSDMQLVNLLRTLTATAQDAEKKKAFRIAAARYARIVELHKRLKPVDYESLAINLEKAGHYLNKSKCYRQALFFYEEAIKINTRLEGRESHTAVNYNNISFVYMQFKDYDQALHYCKKSLELHQKLKDHYQVAINVSNLGQIFFKQEIYEEALKNFQEAIELKTRMGKREDIAQEMYNIGLVYYIQEKYKPAIARIENAINIVSHLKRKDDIARYSATLGELYLKFGQKETAIKYFEKSFSTYYIINKKPRACEVIESLTNLYKEYRDNSNTIKCIRQSIGIYESLENKPKVKSLLKEIAQIYYNIEEFGEAISYYDKATSLSSEETSEEYYNDMYTLALWSRESKQYKKSNNYLSKALNATEHHAHLKQNIAYHLLGLNFFDQKNYAKALDFYHHALTNSSHWYDQCLHLDAVACVYETTADYDKAVRAQEEILNCCRKNRHTETILLIGATKWQKSSYKYQEFKNYYLEALALSSLGFFCRVQEKYQKSLKLYLKTVNLFKDIIAIDVKNDLENACNSSMNSIEPRISKQETFLLQIQEISDIFEVIITQNTGDIDAVVTTLEGLFNANDSLYGIEYCDELLALCEKYIRKIRFAYCLSQMGLRYKQISDYKKSVFHYAKSISIYIHLHEGQLILATLDKLNSVWKSLLENQDIDLESDCSKYLECCVDVAYDIANENVFLELITKLWQQYKDTNDVVKMESYLEKACEVCEKIADVDQHMVYLEILSECYHILGKEDEVIATQEKICCLQSEDEYIPIHLNDKEIQEPLIVKEEKIELEESTEEQGKESKEQKQKEKEKEKSKTHPNPETLKKMGETYLNLKRYEDALLNLNALLVLYKEEDDAPKIGKTLMRIAGIHESQENYQEAFAIFHECLDLAKKSDDKELVKTTLTKLNEVYRDTNSVNQGIEFYKNMMNLEEKENNNKWLGLHTYFVSELYDKNDKVEVAITSYEESLNLYQKLPEERDYINEIDVTQRLIDLYKRNNSYTKLIASYQKLIVLCNENNLYETVEICKDDLYQTCWTFYQEFLTLSDEDKKKADMDSLYQVLLYLANIRCKEGFVENATHEETVCNLREAHNFYKEIDKYCINYKEKIEIEKNKCLTALAQSLCALGDYHMNFEEYVGAIDYYSEEIEIKQKLKHTRGLIESLLKLANAYQCYKEYDNALETFKQIIDNMKSFYSVEEEMQIYDEISKIYIALGDFGNAHSYCKKILSLGEDKEDTDIDFLESVKEKLHELSGKGSGKK